MSREGITCDADDTWKEVKLQPEDTGIQKKFGKRKPDGVEECYKIRKNNSEMESKLKRNRKHVDLNYVIETYKESSVQ